QMQRRAAPAGKLVPALAADATRLEAPVHDLPVSGEEVEVVHVPGAAREKRLRSRLQAEHAAGRLQSPGKLGLDHLDPSAGAAQLGEMPLVVRLAGERREPYERVLSFAHRKRRELVARVLGLVARDRWAAGRRQKGQGARLEEAVEGIVDRCGQQM